MYVANALFQSVFAALNGNVTGTVHDDVPPGTAYPYTVIGELTEAPDDLRDGEGSEPTTTLHVWSAAASGAEVDTIMAEIDVALHRASLVVVGARCWLARREFSQTMRDRDLDTGEVLRHGVVRYRFRLEEA